MSRLLAFVAFIGCVERNRALGNAVVPQLAEHIGQLIVAADLVGAS